MLELGEVIKCLAVRLEYPPHTTTDMHVVFVTLRVINKLASKLYHPC